jgi:Holliday junction DNA helicase RuvA
MISFLRGKLIEALPMRVVLDVRDVGYEILIPFSTFDKLPHPPAEVTLLTHLQVKEDDHTLYGFFTAEERDLFRMLVHHVSGVGPKLALALLSGCSPAQFRTAVIQQDLAFLSKIKGVGKKTAERVVLELKDKVGISDAWAKSAQGTALAPEQQKANDAVLALIALGYKQPEAVRAVETVGPRESLEAVVREALKKI